jgi:outer membrane protein assembly factor BamE (lipoprotein component of BamABCDE complex)
MRADLVVPGVLLAVAALAGCVAPQAVTPPAPAPQAAAPPPAAPPVQASALSYGTVTSRVERGKTTQAELLELFGGPNISTVDAEGNETWVYERSVSQTDVSSQSQNLRGAMGLDVFFGAGAFGGRAGASGEAGRATAQTQTTSSIRTLTVIVKFNRDRTVKDYSARASQF